MEICNYKEGDEEAILQLFKLAFGKELSIEFWNWRFKNNPCKKVENEILLMWENNQLIGHYAVSSIELNYSNEIIEGCLSMTTMTHPNYAGKGIMHQLATKLYQELAQNNINLVIGFPNKNSHYAFINKLNWTDNQLLPNLSFESRSLNNFPKSEYVLSPQFSEIHQNKLSENNEKSIEVFKSINYLNWRYIQHPSNKYIIIESQNFPSNFVVIKFYKSLTISDVFEIDMVELGFFNQFEVLVDILGCLNGYLFDVKINVNSINTFLSLYDKRFTLFEKAGFKMGTPLTFFGYKNLTGLPLSNDSTDWRIYMGDSDVY